MTNPRKPVPDLPPELKYIQAFLYGNASWSYFPLFPWLAYPLVGYAWKKLETEYPSAWNLIDRKKSILLMLAGLFIGFTSFHAFQIITQLPSYYHHQIFLFAWITGLLAGWAQVACKLDNFIGSSWAIRYLKWLGKNVTAAYVIQWLIIGNIATAIYGTQTTVALLLWFVAILSFTSVLTYFYVGIRADRLISSI